MSDFGLAASARNTNSFQSSKTGIGTLNWTAPEVFARHYKQRPESDIWSFGMIVYEVVTRTVPYDGLTLPQITMELCVSKELPDMSLIAVDAPGGLRELIEKCCDFEPGSRPSAAAVARDTAALLQSVSAPFRSMRHHDKVLELLRAIQEGQGRAEKKLDGISAALQQNLTAVLSLVNDDCRYPRTFLMLPKPRREEGGSAIGRMRHWFETCDTFTVVFLCEKTLTPIK